jgi:hypothetical protein
VGCTSETNNTGLNQIDGSDIDSSLNENRKEHLNSDLTLVEETTGEQDVVTNKSDSLDLLPPKETLQLENFHEYINLTKFLNTHVSSSGKVNYKSIAKDKDRLNFIIHEFETNYPIANWTKNQKLSYWINVYNLFTIKLIVDNYPVTSIKKIAIKPWDKKFISLNDNKLSLNDIEHGIIRKQYNDPRVHFALNCASESCPILLNKAYRAGVLSSQLTAQTKKFLSDSSKNDFSDSNNIKISQIFDWYKNDFTKNGTLIDFLNNYLRDKLQSPTIDYLDYSWSLNQ